MSASGPENARSAADHSVIGSWGTRSERRLGCSAFSEWGYFLSPLERPSFFGSLPARLRASRKIHSTWPLALRISSSAQRWTASHMAGSMRRGYCLRAMTCFLIELRCVWLENLSLGTVPKLRLGG